MKDWIIGICNTAADGVTILRARGTDDEIRTLLFKLVQEDKEADEDGWDYGTESVEDVQWAGFHELYAYGVYYDYHIDYTAREFANVEWAE